MKNGEYCNREVVIAEKDSTIVDLARLMKKYHSGDVVIVSKKDSKTVPVGIVTDRDIIIKIVAEQIPLNSISAGDIMSLDIHTVTENSSIWTTFELMRAKGIRRVPVVNDQNELQGILTVDDVLEIIADEASSLARTVRQEQFQERSKTGSI